ncbi:hypothetical protein CJU79_10715 [Pseudomonas fragi]|nr:hypothetical protein CJU79_10715 [Pseudomonas fragi]
MSRCSISRFWRCRRRRLGAKNCWIWRNANPTLWERACSRCKRCGLSARPRCGHREQARSHKNRVSGVTRTAR